MTSLWHCCGRDGQRLRDRLYLFHQLPHNESLPGNLRRQLDAFVTKFNPAGTALVYSTYLGGGTMMTKAMALPWTRRATPT